MFIIYIFREHFFRKIRILGHFQKHVELFNIAIPNHSANFKAIADINLYTYNYHSQNGAPMDIRERYLENYMKFEKLARDAEDKEVNARKNGKLAKKDSKKMWNMIDWKGEANA